MIPVPNILWCRKNMNSWGGSQLADSDTPKRKCLYVRELTWVTCWKPSIWSQLRHFSRSEAFPEVWKLRRNCEVHKCTELAVTIHLGCPTLSQMNLDALGKWIESQAPMVAIGAHTDKKRFSRHPHQIALKVVLSSQLGQI